MEIKEVAKKYPERKKRDRRWFTFEEALIATGNNEYIKEAIHQSSISPQRQLTPRPSIDTTISPPTPPEIESPSIHSSKKSKDAFQALQELMQNASISP